MPRFGWLMLVASVLLAPGAAGAACPIHDGPKLQVGIRPAPPFIMADQVEGQRGIAIDLWEGIAEELKRAGRISGYRYVKCPLGDQLTALAAGRLDVVISPLTITAARAARFDYSQQYFRSGLTAVRARSGGIDFGRALQTLQDTLSQRGVPRAIGIFLAVTLAIAAVVYLRRHQRADYEELTQLPLRGRLFRVWLDGFLRMTGLRGFDHLFRSIPLTLMELVLAVLGVGLSAGIFGVITSAMVSAVKVTEPLEPGDILNGRVVTLADSTSAGFVEKLSRGKLPGDMGPNNAPPVTCRKLGQAGKAAGCVTVGSWPRAMDVLAAGKADYVLGDWAQLSYLVRQPRYRDRYAIQHTTFRFEPYGWGVAPQRDALRKAIDRAMLRRLRGPDWRSTVERYMGEGQISPD